MAFWPGKRVPLRPSPLDREKLAPLNSPASFSRRGSRTLRRFPLAYSPLRRYAAGHALAESGDGWGAL